MSILRYLPGAAALLATVVFAGCGGGMSQSVVARVGNTTITKAALDQWASVLMGGGATSASDTGRGEPLRRRALAFLISAQWLIDEAASLQVAPTGREVSERVDERERKAFPGGQAELHEFLQATGQTVADMELEARAELTSSRLDQLVSGNVPPVTQAQIAAYYREHTQAFFRPEVREVTLTNRKSAAAAERVIREARSGPSFAAGAQQMTVERPRSPTAETARDPLDSAIDAAGLNVLTGPVKRGPDYWVFEVKRTHPGVQESLLRASAAIGRQLRDASLQRALTRAVAAWRARWTARTSCSPGFVVQKCRQYHGPRVSEDSLDFN